MRRDQRGFTLLELLLALAIVGALVVIAFGGVRIALASWRQGEERAEAYQHLRGVALTLARTVGAAYPYNAPRSDTPAAVLLFGGTAARLEFVTQAAAYPAPVPVASCPSTRTASEFPAKPLIRKLLSGSQVFPVPLL